MITKTINLFTYDELTPDAQKRALENWQTDLDVSYWQDEILDSFKAFFDNISGVELKNYSIGAYDRSWIEIQYSHNYEDEIKAFSGKRAFAWFENNLFNNLRIPYTSYQIKTSQRFKLAEYGKSYRAGMIKPCPFTGLYFDDVILDDIKKSLRAGESIDCILNGLANLVQKTLENELDHQQSEEYFREHCDANEIYFLENGSVSRT